MQESNLPQIFNFNEKQIRVVLKDGDPWFVNIDVCRILELNNSREAVSKLKDSQKDEVTLNDSVGRKQKMTIISDTGLYKLVLKSRKAEAEIFQDWVCEVVLPSIRKTGSYISKPVLPETYLDALKALVASVEEKERLEKENILLLDKVEEDKPKVDNYDKFLSGINSQTMNDVAKILGIGRNKLFAFLRGVKILMSNNLPYQEYMDRGYFEVRKIPVTMGDTVSNISQTLVKPKGIEYINKLLKKEDL